MSSALFCGNLAYKGNNYELFMVYMFVFLRVNSETVKAKKMSIVNFFTQKTIFFIDFG